MVRANVRTGTLEERSETTGAGFAKQFLKRDGFMDEQRDYC